MVSKKGQQAQIDTVGEYSVLPGMTSAFNLFPAEKYEACSVTSADIGDASLAYALERDAGII